MDATSPRTPLAFDQTCRSGEARLGDSFVLTLGELLHDPTVEYALTGPPTGPVVIVLGGISADRYPWDWWDRVVGPDRIIDTRAFQVLSINWLGRHADAFDGSSSFAPRSYPLISTHDQARALVCVLDALDIDTVHAFIGSSYGGMVGLAAAAAYPERFQRLMVISGAHRTHPMATAHRAMQRGILELSLAAGHEIDGVTLARALAMTTYRTADEFEKRFETRAGPAGTFEVEQYLLARGRAFSRRFDPRSFAALSHSIDLHWVEPSEVVTPVDLVSVHSDQLVPRWLMDELEEGLAGPCRHHRLTSPWGHDAFLKEADAVGALARQFLREDPHGQTRDSRPPANPPVPATTVHTEGHSNG